jgi:nucleoid DNA-binding protein
MSVIAAAAGVQMKIAKNVWQEIVDVAAKELKKHGEFKLPGIAKLVVKRVPARKACTKMVLGQMRDLPAKPASKKVKARMLKAFTNQII